MVGCDCRHSDLQEDAAPSGVLPLAHVLAVAEGASPSSIVLLLVPPTSGRSSRVPNSTSSTAPASTAAKQRRLELQTIDGAAGQRGGKWPHSLTPLLGCPTSSDGSARVLGCPAVPHT